MLIDDLFRDPARRAYAAKPEMDPLTEDDALQEATFMDARFNVTESAMALLFDLRGALQMRTSNTGVLIARRVRRMEWENVEVRPFPRVIHTVVGSILDNRRGRFSLRVGLVPDSEFFVQADGAEFFVGDVPTLGEAQPHFGDDPEDVIRKGLPSWGSTFIPKFATFLDPLEPA